MTPHGFSHIYELFGTFTLAYIIIDELTENPFISLISEKILRKFTTVNKNYEEVISKIEGHKESLKNILNQKESGKKSKKIQKNFPSVKSTLSSIETRTNNIFSKIKERIRRNYTTRIFVFLNTFILLYCLGMLYYGGLYEKRMDGPRIYNDFSVRMDCSIFVFVTLSYMVLLYGWIKDRQKGIKKIKRAESYDSEILNTILSEVIVSDNKRKKNGKVPNGYYVVAIAFLIILALSVMTFYLSVNIMPPNNDHLHDILIIASVLLPLSNFIVYFFKANTRANHCLPVLEWGAEYYKDSFISEMENVEGFIKAHNYLNTGKLKIVKKDESDKEGQE